MWRTTSIGVASHGHLAHSAAPYHSISSRAPHIFVANSYISASIPPADAGADRVAMIADCICACASISQHITQARVACLHIPSLPMCLALSLSHSPFRLFQLALMTRRHFFRRIQLFSTYDMCM